MIIIMIIIMIMINSVSTYKTSIFTFSILNLNVILTKNIRLKINTRYFTQLIGPETILFLLIAEN